MALMCLTLVGDLLLTTAPARAATPPPLDVRVLDLPSWVGPSDSLRVVLQVKNNTPGPITDLQARLSFYQPFGSRTDLDTWLSGNRRSRTDPGAQDTLKLPDTIGPGESRVVTIAKTLSDVSFLGKQDDRVYPVRVVLSGGRVEAAPVSIPLVFFNQPAPVPLHLALVVPLHIQAVYDENGLVVAARLRQQIGDGRISRILDGLQSFPSVPVTIAPSALLLDTLADLSDGYVIATRTGPQVVPPSDPTALAAATLLARIRQLAVRPQTRLIVSPYSGARLPKLVAAGLADRAEAQVSSARLRLRTLLGADPMPGWVLPTAGELDDPTVTALVGSGLTNAIVSPDSLRRRDSKLTAGAAATLTTRDGIEVPVLVNDPGLAQRLVAVGGQTPPETRERFLAETAALMLEQPGRKRAVVAVAPPDWDPGDAAVGGILDALGRSPWMQATTPDAILADPDLVPSGSIPIAPALPAPPSGAGASRPPADYFASLREAKRMIDRYADLGPPADRLARVETNLLIAESADWWTGRSAIERGTKYAQAVGRIVRGEFAKIRAPGSQHVTLTAHEGVIPIQVRSETDYPIDLVIRLDSDKLGFPDGMQLKRRLMPRDGNVEVRAIARTTGTFPVRVVLETPGQGIVLGSSQLVVRSTAYNIVGLAITGSAGIFLVAWWFVGVIRRRLARAQPAEAPA
ncbi:MAG TPA: DUF6049 family protein [Actinomycetota bacterium]|jgi:hypothetical protein